MKRVSFCLRVPLSTFFVLSIFLLIPEVVVSQAPVRIMPLGNSITYGNYHPETRPEGLITGYRQSLWLMLTNAGYQIDFVGSRRTGADAIPAFDPDNEGYPGWRDDQIRDNVYNWLSQNPPDVIILHIGTNGLDPNPSDVSGILDEIDRFEKNYGRHIKVILAKIINRSTYSQLTTQFNQNIEKMALDRVVSKADDVVVIDMEFETGIDYRLTTSGGEMYDNLHPFVGGHEKMAIRWFNALCEVLPRPNQKPYITSLPSPYANRGIPYLYQVRSDGTPSPTFKLVDPTPGMAIHAATGLITWTPVEPGTFHFTILAENVLGKDTQQVDVIVREPGLRVHSGLVALYDFTETAGNLVHDVSGVGSPLDLYINNELNVVWDPVRGLEISRESLLVPSKMNMKVIDSCLGTNEITLEAWVRTGHIEQGGPAHIIGIADPTGTGITLSQEFSYTDTARYFYTRRLHTSTTLPDGSPSLKSTIAFDQISIQHLVYTRGSDGTEQFYLNGEEAGSGLRTGNLSAWNKNTFKLSLCNSLGFKNPWTGKLFLTAIYQRALSSEEVMQNYNAGILGTSGGVVPQMPVDLQSSALSAVATKLTWSDRSSDETGFLIERKTAGGLYHYLASVGANIKEHVDAGLSPGSTYQYRIKALNDFGESAHSNETTVKTFSDESLYNVSRNKSTSQSSTMYGGTSNLAVDGNTDGAFGNGSVTHTAYELNAWWEVDLGAVRNINYLEVWNRTDMCCKDRMARFNVFVSEEPFGSYDFQTTLNQPGVWSVYEDRYPEPMVTFNVARKGRYIRLQLSDSQEICLAEMVVMGNNHLSPPLFTSLPVTVAREDQEYIYLFKTKDPDADSLVYHVLKRPAWIIFDPIKGSLSGIPTNADTGNHQVTISVYDGLYEVTQTYTLHVENVNDPPEFTSEPIRETEQGALYTYLISANDPDNDSLTISAPSKPSWLSFNPVLRKLTGTPGQNDVGTSLVLLEITDGKVQRTQEFQLTVVNVNDLPEVISMPVQSVNEDESYLYAINASDPDGDTLAYSVVQLPEWLAFDDSLQILSGTPGNDHVGIHDVTIRVSDGLGHIDHHFQITVVNVNDPPELISSPLLIGTEDEEYLYKLEVRDIDGDSLDYTVAILPHWLTFDGISQLLSGIPGNEQVGIHQVSIHISDGVEAIDHKFQITVTNVNDAPEVLSIPAISVKEDEIYNYTLIARDVDGDPIDYSVLQLPDWLSFNDSTLVLSGIPGNEHVGIHQVSISVSDGMVAIDHQFQVAVINVNDLPVITSLPPSSALRPEQLYEYQITAEDEDEGDVLTFYSADLPGWLQLIQGNGSPLLTGTPAFSDMGSHTVHIMVNDGTAEVTQEFSIEVLDPTGSPAGERLIERVYPIPADNFVYLEFGISGEVTLKLFDITGKVIKEFHSTGSYRMKLDLSDLTGNLYLYQLDINGRTMVGKLIKK